MTKSKTRTGRTQPPDVLKFDRRTTKRSPADGIAMAAFDDGFGGTVLSSVELLDTSTGGLGLRSPVRARVGAGVTLYPDGSRWPPYTAVVARCDPDDDYFRIGLALASRRAA